jgi:hypothetical protein
MMGQIDDLILESAGQGYYPNFKLLMPYKDDKLS